VNKLKGLTAVF